jgi:MarR family transcriptional regulator, lower aerobic nicotinate degradation pathway regulator
LPWTLIIYIVIIMTIKSMSISERYSRRAPKAAPGAPGPLVKFERTVPAVRRVPLALARRFFQICTSAAAASIKDADLTPLEFAVMAYINKLVGEPDIDQSTLAARLGIDRNNTCLLVERLESRGLLERRTNGEDRRARLLRLTPRGERLHGRLYPKAFADQQRILQVLSPSDRETLLDLLVRVIEGNLSLARPGAGRRKRGLSKRI